MNFNSDMFRKMSACYAPCGDEERLKELIKEEICGIADEIYEDEVGNIIARKKGNGKKVLTVAHMDQVGLIVTSVDEKGFPWISDVGCFDEKLLIGQRVIFSNGTCGIICAEENEEKKNVEMRDLYLDIGCTDRSSALKLVQPGDLCIFDAGYYENETSVVCPAADDRIGCYIMIETMKNIGKTDNDLYFAFVVQEELASLGAHIAAKNVQPELAIAVDVTETGDMHNGIMMDVRLGGGAAIKVKDNHTLADIATKEKIVALAEEKSIKYQLEILPFGGTDVSAIQRLYGGIACGAISVPTRNTHTPGEIFRKSDVNDCIELLRAVLAVDR